MTRVAWLRRSDGREESRSAMFAYLGTVVSRRWLWVLLGWAVLVLVVRHVAPRWETVTCDGDFAYLPAEMSSVQGERLLEAAFPDALSRSNLVLIVARTQGPLGPADYAVADRLVEKFTPEPDDKGPIVGVLSHRTPVIGQKLTSEPGPDGQAVLVLLQLRNEFMAIGNMPFVKEIYSQLDAIRAESGFPKGLQLGVTGSAAIGADMLFSAEESIHNTELATCLLVVAILLVVYRSPGLVVVPLLTIFLSLLVATGLVALIAQWSQHVEWLDFKIFKTTRIFVVVILYGAVTDYCLFLIARYREELSRGHTPAEALALALGKVGHALVGSAMTTIVGLGCMVFADFGKFRNSGPAIALCLVVALAASLSLAPALLRSIGLAVFWPFGMRIRPVSEDAEIPTMMSGGILPLQRFWPWLSRQITTQPGMILVGCLLFLAPLAYHGLSVEVTYDLLAELRAERPSVVGTQLLRRHFAGGEIGPVTVLACNENGRFATASDRWERIGRLAEELHQLEYVDSQGNRVHPIKSVRSLADPLGDRASQFGLFGGLRKGVLRSHHRTKNTYLAQAPRYVDKVTRLDLVFQYDPFSIESIRLLDHVENYLQQRAEEPTSPWKGTSFFFRGTTAGFRDLRAVTASDQLLIERLVTIAVLAVLLVLIGRPVVSSYLILSVLLGYFVTIGTCMILFSWLYGNTFHGLDWKVPIFLFVILIAVGEDYNIYLVTRVFEEQRVRGGVEGVRVALAQTGGIITSCGVIMAGTFVAMVAGSLRAMHELGFALALGVLLDTFVIRTILVPAFLVLWGRVESTSPSPPPEPAKASEESRGASRVASQEVHLPLYGAIHKVKGK